MMPGLFAKEGQPYHDVMLALDGEAARTLGGWARERWLRATGDAGWPHHIPLARLNHLLDAIMPPTPPAAGSCMSNTADIA